MGDQLIIPAGFWQPVSKYICHLPAITQPVARVEECWCGQHSLGCGSLGKELGVRAWDDEPVDGLEVLQGSGSSLGQACSCWRIALCDSL